MNKRKCEDCDEEMELWYLIDDHEEWFCDNCKTYKEYRHGELVNELYLNGVE